MCYPINADTSSKEEPDSVMTGRSRGNEAWAGLEGLDDEVLLCGFLEVLWPL